MSFVTKLKSIIGCCALCRGEFLCIVIDEKILINYCNK